MENPVQLTPRFTEAVDYARQVHVGLRKGTQVPYMAHLERMRPRKAGCLGVSNSCTGLLNWTQVLIEPMQGFFDELVAREIVAGVVENMFFLIAART
jgi:hypothetical protein